MWMKKAINFQKVKVQPQSIAWVLLRFLTISAWVGYKNVAYKKSMYIPNP